MRTVLLRTVLLLFVVLLVAACATDYYMVAEAGANATLTAEARATASFPPFKKDLIVAVLVVKQDPAGTNPVASIKVINVKTGEVVFERKVEKSDPRFEWVWVLSGKEMTYAEAVAAIRP